MKYSEHIQPSFTIGSITKAGSKLLLVKITIDFHRKNSVERKVLAHVYKELLLSGSAKTSRETMQDKLALLGASIAIDTNNGALHISIKAPAAVAKKVLTLFNEIIAAPNFSQSEFVRVIKLTKNQLHEHKENTRALAHEQFLNTCYTKADRRSAGSIAQSERALSTLTRKDIRALHAEICSTHWHVTVGGNASVVADLTATMKRLPLKQPKAAPKVHQTQSTSKKFLVQDVPAQHNIEFSIGHPVPLVVTDKEYAALSFGVAILGLYGGFTGRLMSTVREKEGLTYTIYASIESASMEETGYFRIFTFFSPQQAAQGVASTMRELRRLISKGITDSEYKRFKEILRTRQVLQADSLEKSVVAYHAYIKSGSNRKEMLKHQADAIAVSKASVNKALRTYINPDSLIVSAAGPVRSVQKVIALSL